MYKKRMTAWLLVIILICSMGIQAFAQNTGISYSDIEGHWAQEMIEEFSERGYLKGYDDGTFRPDNPISRAEAGVFVSKLGLPETYPLINYRDLIEGAWYYEGVMAATRTGFVNGYPDGTYQPDAFILRQEAAKLASHFWEEVNMEDFQMQFSDNDQIAPWAFPHMSKLVKMELLDGYPDNTIRPVANLTRAEFVKLFYKLLIEPDYANVTVRAVNINNPSYDIIDPKVVSHEIASTVEFDAPDVPSPWQLVGDAKQTHVIEQGLEVVFEYRYVQPSTGYTPTPTPKYTLSLGISQNRETIGDTVTEEGTAIHVLTFDNDIINLTTKTAGVYRAGSSVTVTAEALVAIPGEDGQEASEDWIFEGWYENFDEESVAVSNNATYTFDMPSNNYTLYANFEPGNRD